MKIRDLDLDQYVIVYDIGKSEKHKGMTVVGRVEEIVFHDDGENAATIDSLGNLYDITDDNDFELWTKSIEDKTESINTTVKWNDNGNLEVKDNYEIKVPDELLDDSESDLVGYLGNEINQRRLNSNDVQQRKRSYYTGSKGDDLLDYMFAQFTPEEAQGFIKMNIIKYASRLGKKDDVVKELDKIIDYATRYRNELSK